MFYAIIFPESPDILLFFSQCNSSVFALLAQVNAKLRLPIVLHKFLQPITLSPEDFFAHWKTWNVQSLKVQEVVGLTCVISDHQHYLIKGLLDQPF